MTVILHVPINEPKQFLHLAIIVIFAHVHFIETMWHGLDFKDRYHECVYADSPQVAHTLWLHFCLKATEDSAAIISELFAGPVASDLAKASKK